MRAKVASRARGHVFEDRFLQLDGLQLAIAYRQALKDEKREFEQLKVLNESWVKRLENHFQALYIFTNPKMYKNYEDAKEMEGLREEIKAEDFPALWDEITKAIPSEIVVSDPEENPYSSIPKVDFETDQIITGFVSYLKREGG